MVVKQTCFSPHNYAKCLKILRYIDLSVIKVQFYRFCDIRYYKVLHLLHYKKTIKLTDLFFYRR